MQEAELEDFDFTFEAGRFPQVERSLDADGIEFFVNKDVSDSV